MKSKYLIVGSGIAGLSFALRVADKDTVSIVTKKRDFEGATNLAQGGVAAVLAEDDTFAEHIRDTLDSGDGLCDKGVVELVVEEGPERIADLIEIGVEFVHSESNPENLSLGREGGHSKRRVAHANDLTGREIERALIERVRAHENINLFENATCVDLIMEKGNARGDDRKCLGAYVLLNGDVKIFTSSVTVLCTGGVGKAYLYTSNPDIATGDGVAMAFRAGAEVSNMEFIQFHPTCLYHTDAKNFLISEAVRGEGAVLLNKAGERFMKKYEPESMELSTRDKVARAIDREMKETGCDCVYLDISHKSREYLEKRFPGIYGKCKELGIDISKKPIPVVPAAHYLCGGVLVDSRGRTSINRLFALGEVACTGLHGANRLASNSLLEAIVYAKRAATFCNEKIDSEHDSTCEVDEWAGEWTVDLDEEILINHNWDLIRRIMWNYVGIVRSEMRLALAAQQLSDVMREVEEHYWAYRITPAMVELRNIAIVASLIIEAAKLRKESRGLHTLQGVDESRESERKWNVFSMSEKSTDTPWYAEKRREIKVD